MGAPGGIPAAGDWLSGRAPRSHRGGHWFDPSIAHPAQRPVAILQLAVFDARTTPKYSNGLAAQPLPELLERVAGGGRGNLGIDLHRDSNLAVPEDLHRYARMHVEGGQQRTACLAGAVDRDPRHLGLDDAAIEAAVEVSRLQCRAVTGGEHQAGVDPGTVSSLPVGLLLLLTEFECGYAEFG